MNIDKLKEKYNTIAGSGNTKTFSIILLVSFIAIGYIFFFNTTKIIGENFDFTVSEIGQIIELESNHSVKLVRADIDRNINAAEFEFYFQNTNFDGCNDYTVTIKSASKSGRVSILNSKVLCPDSDVYVIRANLPKSWYAVSADITLKNKEDLTLEAKFYSTEETFYKTEFTSEPSRDYFLQLDMKRNIETLQNDIEALSKNNQELQNKIILIDESIANLQNRFSYMTAAELSDAEQQILSMTSEKNNALAETDNNNKTIKKYQNNISELQTKLKGA